MQNKSLLILLVFFSHSLFAAQTLDLYKAPIDSLNQFPAPVSPQKSIRALAAKPVDNNSLQQVNQTVENGKSIVRYQQMYNGIPVIGAQIMITNPNINGINARTSNALVNGHLLKDIQINTKPALKSDEAIELAKNSYFKVNEPVTIRLQNSQLQIRPDENNELTLVYQVTFKCMHGDNKPAWPFFVVNAQTGAIIKQWNNIKTYSDSGPGGNERVHQYWYGKDGLPALDVLQRGSQCVMDTSQVKLVNVDSRWDWGNLLLTPFEYPCNQNQAENINGAFSPANDAYYFGHTIVSMYHDWYGLNALQNADGSPMKLIMRVHFGQNYDNAFWDGYSMSFGDGNDYYPLVSLDVAGHEVTHGFTEQHSNLEYHDQPGALNESVSDMAGQASRAYLLEKVPQLYSKAYFQSNDITWGIGETIVRDSYSKALRFMDYPSSDGSSADCLDKSLAQSKGAYCAISYEEVVAYANANISNPQDRENFIVHTASGVFNKAFYLLSQKLGIKEAYRLMIVANTKYWTPGTAFINGACGVLYAAKDLAQDIDYVKDVFGKVGIDTNTCSI